MAASPGAGDAPTLGVEGGSAAPRDALVRCFSGGSSQRLQAVLQFVTTPLRRAHAAVERRLTPHSLAAARLRTLKERLRWRHGTPRTESATELTQQGGAPAEPPAAPEPQRSVLLGAPRAAAAAVHASYRGNATTTAKYNLLTFVPRFLFEMFSRVAYIYFFVQAALSWWPAVSPFDPWGSTIALAFVLLASAIKALWEDAKRHRDDWATNARRTRVMCGDGAFRPVAWRQVRVGDIVMVRDGEEVPADLLCVYAALPERVCYVQTTNLDGETNLKIRSPVLLDNTPAAHLAPRAPSDVTKLRGRVVCESPNANLHHFNGRIDIFPPHAATYGGEPEAHAAHGVSFLRSLLSRRSAAAAALASLPATPLASLPLSMNDVLLRGCKLKNSDYVLGVVLYAGPDTRIMKNARRAPFKAGAFDRWLNVQIPVLIAVQAVLCALMAVGTVLWRRSHYTHWYFQWREPTGSSYSSDLLYGVFNFLTFWVLFSYLVPISLFVSMEIVKFMQGAAFVNNDERMRDPATRELALARNTNLNEDLGMVEYVFSDKTGTLTSNEMRLRLLVLGGEAYGDAAFQLERCDLPPRRALRAFDARLAAALLDGGGEDATGSSDVDVMPTPAGPSSMSTADDATAAAPLAPAGLQRAAVEAFSALAVCHTLIVEQTCSDDAGNNAAEVSAADCTAYQGPSPDEVALVDGARRLGVRFASRSASGVVVDFLGESLSFEVLAVLAFTSERQRMSVVVRRPDGRLSLICKGSDAALLPLLAPPRDAAQAAVLRATEAHLHRLAVLGLRTLVLASRDLNEAEWAAWEAAHQAAVVSLDAGREARVAAQAESGLTLLGATGVEDKLQEGVPDTIRTLLAARMRVWVITGDKQETAITVGAACGLLRDPDTALLLNAETQCDTAVRMAELQAQALARAADAAGDGARGPELVVDGHTLTHVLADRSLSADFAALGAGARAVVVCRASPRQKSAVVKLMHRYLRSDAAAAASAAPDAPWRRWLPRRVRAALRRLQHRPPGRTLAIGDGANDVAMLQAADVGVGVTGKEGRQAANNADFSLGQFRFLARLLLVHGSLSQYRLSRLIKYSLYKNVVFAGLLFYYQFYCGFSGQALYDSISAGLYNVVLTSLPVIAFALLDRPASDAALLAHPQLYNSSTSLSGHAFWKTLLDAHVHSAICFFFALYAVQDTTLSDMLAIGKVAYTAVLFTVTLEILLVARHITVPFAVLTALSFVVWFPLLWLVPLIANVNEMIGMAQQLFPSPVFWLTVALCGVTSVGYRLAWVAGARYFRPHDVDILAEAEAKERWDAAAARRRRPQSSCWRAPRENTSPSQPASDDELAASTDAAAHGV